MFNIKHKIQEELEKAQKINEKALIDPIIAHSDVERDEKGRVNPEDKIFRGNLKDIVLKIAKALKFDKVKYKELGAGWYGRAFELPNGKVLKLTTDRREYLNAIKLKGKKNKHIIDVFDAYELEAPYEGVFALVTEKMNFNEALNNKLWYEINDYLIPKKTTIKKLLTLYFRNQIPNIDFYLDCKGLSKEACKFAWELVEAVDGMKLSGINSEDFRPGNFGHKSNGNLALLDLGGGTPKDVKTVKLKIAENLNEKAEVDTYIQPRDVKYSYPNRDIANKKFNIALKKLVLNVAKALKFKNVKYKELGEGYYGRAFELPNGKVLKVTNDKQEYDNAVILKGHSNKHIIDVYTAYELDKPYEGVYVIITEKVTTYPDTFTDYWKNIEKDIPSDYWDLNNFLNAIQDNIVDEDEVNDTKSSIKNKSELKFFNGLIDVLNDISYTGIENRDFHPNNFGMKNNQVCLLDLGGGNSFDDEPTVKLKIKG